MAIIGNGSISFYRWDWGASSPTWDKVADVLGIRSFDISQEILDVTPRPYVFDLAVRKAYRSKLPGHRTGQLTMSMLFSWAGYQDILSDLEREQATQYKIVVVAGASKAFRFQAIVNSLGFVGMATDKVVCDVSFELHEQPTIQIQATDVPDKEVDVLMDFYNATGGSNWTNNSGWGTDPIVANWYGITVSGGHVTGMNLENNNLSGDVGTTLSDLYSTLTVLRLEDNSNLKGDTANFSNFTSLTWLRIGCTLFEGSLFDLQNLTALEYLNIMELTFTGSLSAIASLTALKDFKADHTEISGDISYLSSMSGLEQLWLPYTSVSGNISNLSSLPLTSIKFNGTSVEGDISNLSSMDLIQVEFNGCSGIEGDISNLASSSHVGLKWVNFSNSSVDGDIGALKDHTSMISFCFGNTDVSGDVGELITFTSLETLYLPYTSVDYSSPSAGLPSEWDDCDIYLANCSWTQTEVNAFLCDLNDASVSSTKTLDLAGNNLAPTTSGENCQISLESKGWTVYTNEPSALKDEPDGDTIRDDISKG